MHDRPSPKRRAIQLAGWRLASSGAWRFACAASVLFSVGFTLSVLYLAHRGQGAFVTGAVSRAALVIGWTAGLAVGFWNATDRASIDRAEGVVALARCHGLPTDFFGPARALAASIRLSVLVGLATLPVALAAISAAPSLSVAAWRTLALVPLALYACGTGLVGGALASLCGALAPRHGRSLLTALVLVPWALDGVLFAGHARVGSLPGALGFLASLAASVGTGS